MNNEPTMEQIDDYNNQESPQKRKTIWAVIIGIIILGAIYSMVKYNYNTVDDYIGTQSSPGINTTKN